MVQSVVFLTAALALAAVFFGVVDAQKNNVFNLPGLPNFNGPQLAAAMGQLIPSPSGLSSSDDTDFQGTPCSVDINFGTRTEYNCFCAQTAVVGGSTFYCAGQNPHNGSLLVSGATGALVGASVASGYGTTFSGVEVGFVDDCYVKDVKIRVKMTQPNNTEITQTINIYSWNSDTSSLTPANFENGQQASFTLYVGQVKNQLPAVDTCEAYRLAAFYTGGNAAQNEAVLNYNTAYSDKIGLYCDPLPLQGGSGLCTNDMELFSDALATAQGSGTIWSGTVGNPVSGIPQFCPVNKGQSYPVGTQPLTPTNAQLDSWYIHTDEYDSGAGSSPLDLLATNTLAGNGSGLHQTGAPQPGTGVGLNGFDGFIFFGGQSYSPCWDELTPASSSVSPVSAAAFFLNLNDVRPASPTVNGIGGTTGYLNMWCVDILCEPIPPSPTPTTTAAIVGDPHFKGFHGEVYDVMAEPGEVFNILSDTDVQLNALFIGGASDGAERTFIGEYGLKYDGHYVRVTASGRVFIDDAVLPIGSEERSYSLDTTGDSFVTSKALRNGNVHVTVLLPSYSFTFGVINYRNVMHSGAPAHINLHMAVRSNDVHPHGLLGQTVLPESERAGRQHNTAKEGGDVIEGTYLQYRVSGNNLFGDDFKYNQFGLLAKSKRSIDAENIVNLSAFLG